MIPGQEDPLQKGMATHSSILSWRFPWTEEPGGLPFMGLQRVRHDLATKHAVEIILSKEGGRVKKKKATPLLPCWIPCKAITNGTEYHNPPQEVQTSWRRAACSQGQPLPSLCRPSWSGRLLSSPAAQDEPGASCPASAQCVLHP